MKSSLASSRRFANAPVGVAFLFALGTTAGCSDAAAPTKTERAPEGTPSSRFAWVGVRPASDATAEEVPARLIQVSGTEAVVVPPMPAHIRRLLVKPGDNVDQGAPIVEVIMPDVDAAVASATASRNALRILQKRKDRLVALAKDGLVRASEISKLDLDMAAHTSARLRAQAILTASAVTRGGVITLRTPIAGVVTDVAATLGELRRPEDGPIARIRSLRGQRIEATFATHPAKDATYEFRTQQGELPLSFVNAISSPNGFGVVAWFEPPSDVDILVATEGRVRVLAPTTEGAWLVHAMTIGQRDGHSFVISRASNAAAPSRVEVEVLRTSNADAIVVGPLQAGALLAADPALAFSLVDEGSSK